jgi:hypothetical protein
LAACDAIGISRTVEVFMMLLYGKAPLTEPLAKGLNHSLALERMLVENFPLGGRGSARLIQYLDVDGNLSYVM